MTDTETRIAKTGSPSSEPKGTLTIRDGKEKEEAIKDGEEAVSEVKGKP